MKRIAWIVVLIVCILAGGAVVWKRHVSAGAYTLYISQRLQVQLEYPSSGWRLEEAQKPQGRYVGRVQIFGPRRKDLKYSPYLVVTAAPTPEPTLNAAAQSVIATRLQQRSYHVVRQAPVRCAGTPAVRVETTYELVLPLHVAKPAAVAFREINVYCLHDGKLYTLSLAAPAEDVSRCQPAFEHLTKTLQFLP